MGLAYRSAYLLSDALGLRETDTDRLVMLPLPLPLRLLVALSDGALPWFARRGRSCAWDDHS